MRAVLLHLIKKYGILIAMLPLFYLQIGFAQVYPLSDQLNSGNWVLLQTVSDEFDQAVLDETKWQIQGKNGIYKSNFIGRAPSQFSPNNAFVANDRLNIQTKWEPDFNFSSNPQNGVAYENITTAAVISKQQFQYGYMEIKCKAAKAEVTSSFWTTGYQSELDMFEMFGDPDVGEASLDWRTRLKFNMISWDPNNYYYLPDGNGPAHTRNIQADNNTADAFHVYGFDWTSEYIKVYIDGVLHPNGTILKSDITNNGTDNDRWVTDVPYWIWFDSETFPWLGIPEESDLVVPVNYEIEYIRVWQTNEIAVVNVQDAAEPDSDGEFRVSLPNGTVANQDIIVNYSVGGTATEGVDYDSLSGSVTILNGENFASIPIYVINDAHVEGDENVTITITSVSEGVFNSSPAQINISDGISGTVLTAGDVAIVGWKAEGNNNGAVAFMLLKDITSGTKITFSNRSWSGTQNGWNGDYAVDDVITWTTDVALSSGTILKLDIDGIVKRTTGGVEVIVGSTVHDNTDFDLSRSGDSVLIYQVYGNFVEPTDPMSSAWITGLNTNGGWGTGGGNAFCALPTALTNGLNAISVGVDQDNGVYVGEIQGGVSSLRASINSDLNWVTSEDENYYLWSHVESVGTNFGDIGISGTLSNVNPQIEDKTAIYPNPIYKNKKDKLYISSLKASQIIVRDMLGKELININKHSEPQVLSVENLKSGVYFINLISDKKIETKKIIVN